MVDKKNNKAEVNEEPTVKFSEDGTEYKISEMSDEARTLFARWQEKKNVRDEFVLKANNDIDDLNRLMASYEAQMKQLLEDPEAVNVVS